MRCTCGCPLLETTMWASTEVMFTMADVACGPRAAAPACSNGIEAWLMRKAPVEFTANTSFHSSSGRSAKVLERTMPALLTSRSIRPDDCCSTARIASRTAP
jgi:hypothetical protein